MPGYLRLLTPVMNIPGAMSLLLGAVFSTYVFMPKKRILPYSLDPNQPGDQFLFNLCIAPVAILVNLVASLPGAARDLVAGRLHSRVPATILIAIGAFFPTITDSLNRAGFTDLFALGKFLGVVFLFAGFLVSAEVFREVRIPFTGVRLATRTVRSSSIPPAPATAGRTSDRPRRRRTARDRARGYSRRRWMDPLELGTRSWTAIGPRDAPGLVFLHGTRLSRAQWWPQLRRLSGSFRCVALDLPGHGALADEPFTIDAAIGTVCRAIDAEIPSGRAILVGLSMGGYVAIDAAEAHPERVAGLVLAGCSAETFGPIVWPFRFFRWLLRNGAARRTGRRQPRLLQGSLPRT